jgi:hypothetical protein
VPELWLVDVNNKSFNVVCSRERYYFVKAPRLRLPEKRYLMAIDRMSLLRIKGVLLIAFLLILPAAAELAPRQTATIPDYVTKYGTVAPIDLLGSDYY